MSTERSGQYDRRPDEGDERGRIRFFIGRLSIRLFRPGRSPIDPPTLFGDTTTCTTTYLYGDPSISVNRIVRPGTRDAQWHNNNGSVIRRRGNLHFLAMRVICYRTNALSLIIAVGRAGLRVGNTREFLGFRAVRYVHVYWIINRVNIYIYVIYVYTCIYVYIVCVYIGTLFVYDKSRRRNRIPPVDKIVSQSATVIISNFNRI